jgi:hypothetical protein
MKSLLAAAVALSVFAGAGTWMLVRHAQAQTHNPVIYPVSPQVQTLGMVGLGPGQTARLYALNLPGLPAPGSPQIHSLPCNVTLSFMDNQGGHAGDSLDERKLGRGCSPGFGVR